MKLGGICMNNYELFCEHMKRYENGERKLNEEEKKIEEFISSDGRAFQPLPFDIFLENMRRYEDGERELNDKEKIWKEYLISNGIEFEQLSFEIFLENMEKYTSEKSSHKHL